MQRYYSFFLRTTAAMVDYCDIYSFDQNSENAGCAGSINETKPDVSKSAVKFGVK
jgi:hypothetical protein